MIICASAYLGNNSLVPVQTIIVELDPGYLAKYMLAGFIAGMMFARITPYLEGMVRKRYYQWKAARNVRDYFDTFLNRRENSDNKE